MSKEEEEERGADDEVEEDGEPKTGVTLQTNQDQESDQCEI